MASPYDIAKSFTGARETDAKLNDFLYNGGQNLTAAERAWCSDFVKAAATQAGIKTNATGMARSWLNEGTPVDDPQPGDVAVLSRTNDPSKGHVGFFEGRNPDGTIKLFSGNHADTAASANYPASRVLGYRRLTANDPRNVAQNSQSAGIDPDGAAGIAGSIHTSQPVDTGVAYPKPPVSATPSSPKPAPGGAFGGSIMAGLGKSVGAFTEAMSGGAKDPSQDMLAQLEKQNTSALSEEEQRAAQALQMVTARNPRKRQGAFG